MGQHRVFGLSKHEVLLKFSYGSCEGCFNLLCRFICLCTWLHKTSGPILMNWWEEGERVEEEAVK